MRIKFLTLLLAVLVVTACRKNDGDMQPSQGDMADYANIDLENYAEDDTIAQVCVDKTVQTSGNLTTNAVLVDGKKWGNGKVLRVYFLNGGDYYQDKVMKYARVWADYANVGFVKVTNKSKSDIRVGFKINKDHGSWSYLGRDANDHPKQTMNFGWFNKKTTDEEFSRTITHEFGHALGLDHEQLSPVEKINWDKPKVYRYYMGPPNNWTREQVDYNIFDKYTNAETDHTKFDPKSIMQYPVDAKLTTDHKAIGVNYYLSAKDKTFIANVYPKKGGTN